MSDPLNHSFNLDPYFLSYIVCRCVIETYDWETVQKSAKHTMLMTPSTLMVTRKRTDRRPPFLLKHRHRHGQVSDGPQD